MSTGNISRSSCNSDHSSNRKLDTWSQFHHVNAMPEFSRHR